MEDNIDIDEQIKKIKEQMSQGFDDPDNSMFRMSEELSLSSDEFSDEETAKEEKIIDPKGDIMPAERFYQPEQEENWQDPFGRINENDAVKKFVIYISKEFLPEIENLDTDARSAFVNDALQIKREMDKKDRRLFLYTRLLKHVFICILTISIAIPFLFWLVQKSIVVTQENYGYVQNSFQVLYTQKEKRQQKATGVRVTRPR